MKTDSTQLIRRIIQIVSFGLSVGFLILVIAGANFVIHQACPYALVCFGLNGGAFLRLGGLVMGGAVIFGFAVLIYGMFFGRRFCAWLCPLGSLQEWIFLLRSRKYRIKHRMPHYNDSRLAWLKYLVLALTILLSLFGVGYIYIRLCPFYSLSLLPRLAIPGVILLALVILGSFFYDRLWCRFLCPYAGLMNAFQGLAALIGISRKKVKRNLERCTDCGVCSLYCPMNINIAEFEYVHNPKCIHCGICAQKCPKPGTYSEECECKK